MIYAEWYKFAQENNYRFILILRDLEDQELFPVYFRTEQELESYRNNIISETKVKIIEIIKS